MRSQRGVNKKRNTSREKTHEKNKIPLTQRNLGVGRKGRTLKEEREDECDVRRRDEIIRTHRDSLFVDGNPEHGETAERRIKLVSFAP